MLGIKATETWKDVEAIPLRTPKDAGSYWKGLRHGDLINAVWARWKKEYDFHEGRSRFGVVSGGLTMAASFLTTKPINGHVLGLGLLTSNNRRLGLKFYLGWAQVDTTKGCTHWNRGTFSRWCASPFTTNFNLEFEVDSAFEWWKGAIPALDARRFLFMQNKMTKEQILDTVNLAATMGVMPFSRGGRLGSALVARLENGEKITGWELVGAFGNATTLNPIVNQFDQQRVFNEIVYEITNK